MIDRATSWTIEHPKTWRTISTMIHAAVVVTSFKTALDEDNPMMLRVMFFGLACMYAAVQVVMWRRWLRKDVLDELAQHVERQGGGNRQHIVWMLAYNHLPTSTVKQVNAWLRVHDIRRVPPADMPDEIKSLHAVLFALGHEEL